MELPIMIVLLFTESGSLQIDWAGIPIAMFKVVDNSFRERLLDL